ncbi:ABC transporter substrate-binding protein [Spirillospora sp. CA-128828]|uniref:ABC transporter substrate-binding protein n=1 Tax=Spirillospora sp. CA-128828 TaxID=3240033 RepID=UPI003D94AB4E
MIALRASAAVAALLLAGTALSACGGDDSGSSDDGVTITMWTRSPTEAQSRRLVDAYNASHRNKVKLTVIPVDNYQPRIAAAAGARKLPDVFASDVVFVPKYASQGLFLDISDRIAKLPTAAALAPSHMRLGTYEGRKYTLPHTLDLSVLFYNKVLYKKAGLAPDKPPKTLKEFARHATTIRKKVGGDTYGTFFGGSCGGCYVFTYWPSVWAAGGDVMDEQGTRSTIDGPQAQQVFQIYNDLWRNGVVDPAAKPETGATWTGVFPKGKTGLLPMPSTTLGLMPDNDKVKVGVAPIPGPDGGESTFVGGDSVGISATSKHADAAWDFISWTVSDQAQVEVVAKNKDVVARTDLASNKYSSADPRIVLINGLVAKGRTPFSLNFGPTYNDPNGPWLQVARSAVFGNDVGGALRTGAQKLTGSLKQP